MSATASYTLQDQERMAKAANYFNWQYRLVTRALGQRVIEVGCGIGNFTSLLLDRQAVIALDAEPDCIDRLNQRFPNQHNLHTFASDICDPAFPDLKPFRADSCLCLNVLEHIEDDREALHRMAHSLISGGVIVLLLPAFPSLYGGIDERLGHYRRYTRKSIQELARVTRLHVDVCHYVNAIGFFAWWTNAHVLKREAQSESQIQFFDRFVVPVSSRLETFIHPPFGQSLFVILKKS